MMYTVLIVAVRCVVEWTNLVVLSCVDATQAALMWCAMHSLCKRFGQPPRAALNRGWLRSSWHGYMYGSALDG
jgi:hypothetical protein